MSRREQLEQLLQSNPDDVFLHYALALTDVAEGDTAGGIRRLDDVLRRDPNYVAAYFQKGQLLAEQDRREEAREVLELGIQVAHQVGDAHAEAEMTAFLESL